MENLEKAEVASNRLLSEILGVLRRIDGHLEAQEGRIGALDVKVNALTSGIETPQHWTPVFQSTGFQLKTNSSAPGITRSGIIPPLTSPPAKSYDLKRQIFSRKASVESRGPRDSVVSGLAEPALNHEPHYGKTHQKTDAGRIGSIASPFDASPTIARSGTWNSIEIPPTNEERKHVTIRMDDEDIAYSKAQPPDDWITTRSLWRVLDVKYGSEEAQALWTSYVGDSWIIPPDGRVELTFQRHLLERLEKEKVTELLQTLKDVSTKFEVHDPSDIVKRGSFRVSDFGFDPSFEESVIEYRAEFPTGKYKDNPTGTRVRRNGHRKLESGGAPWKRMIEIRGLSKSLTNENEMWSGDFRDPFFEALPNINSVCPFLTDRERDNNSKSYTGMNLVNQAVLHHQKCWRQPPPCDDNLSFHITFYEIVDLARENELDDEIWRSGPLHSENEKELDTKYGVACRRIRESACTIALVHTPNEPDFWTSVYLCPNNFDLYDKIPSLIADQNAQDVLLDMIEFTMHMVIERWRKVEKYFGWLIGHRDTLSDLEAHDSLLFDDDTFSRSRKYFWAINYLAELDISIAENIVQLERWVGWGVGMGRFGVRRRTDVRPLSERLAQLKELRSRLKAQREEAIALRDGLFSASGVMESRASTRLGENVKLLTFVSIFFLPLSFCMSIWSLNSNPFSLKALIIVVILVGLGTYFMVFNINNMVRICGRFYDQRKKIIIKLMKEDEDSAWIEQGKRFEALKPKQEKLRPSEWVIALFVLHRITHGLRVRFWLKSWNLRKRKVISMRKESDQWPELTFQSEAIVKEGDVHSAVAVPLETHKSKLKILHRVFRRDAMLAGRSTNV